MMKKITLFAACALMLGLTSCLGGDDPKSESTHNVPTYALTTDSKGETTVSATGLTFVIDNIGGTATVKFTGLDLGGVATTFTTSKIPYLIGPYMMTDNMAALFYLIEAANATGEGADVTDFNCDLTPCSNTLNPNVLASLTDQLALDPIVYPGNRSQGCWYTSIQFKTGDYSVMTFWNDMLYTGQSNIDITESDTFEDKNSIIRVKLNLAKAGDYKANVYFYNYKFTNSLKEEENVLQNFVFTDVPVKFDGNGFVIDAADVTPVSLKEKNPVVDYKMSSLKIKSTDKMSSIDCEFEQADRLKGKFKGIGLYEFDKSDIKQ